MSPTSIQTSLLLVLNRLVLWISKRCSICISQLYRVLVWLKFLRKQPPAPPPNDQAPYTIVNNGKRVSLDGISTSLYPFSGNIRNTSRASVRSSHNPSVQSRNASRSSRRPESYMSRTTSFYDLHIYPPSRPHPLPRRQWSVSAPHLVTDPPERTGSIGIEVTSPASPGNYSQNSLNIPHNTQPLAYDPNVDTINSPTNYEQTTFEVPPSPSTTTHEYSRSNDQGESSSVSRVRSASHRSSSPSSTLDPDARYIRPAFPCETKRYNRRTKLRNGLTNLTFPPITLDYASPAPPEGWVRFAHPEGARYFYNQTKRIYTDSEIYDPEILAFLEADYDHLKSVSGTFTNPFPDSGEFVINVYRLGPGDDFESEYYCIDHRSRLVFFLKEFKADWMGAWEEVKGVRSAHQLQIELLAQYWFFVQLYPSALDLTEQMVRDMRDIILHLIGDSMTSPFSTACYPIGVLYKILTLTRELERNTGPGTHGSMCLLARKMYILNHSRFLNFHGESSARIERDFSVYDDQSLGRRTWLIKTLSFVLFSAPDVHLKSLHKMWVDGMMHKAVWEDTMKRLNEEWQEFIFFATVVLNANVAFLAIQSVDIDSDPYRSPAQIASYLSVVANIGSIILGLLLMRQNRTKNRETADDVQKFLTERNHPRLGLESLAILYSLPYALLMWGMVSFLAAFAFMWFQNSSAPTRSLVGSSCCAMTILIVWCIYVSWEKKVEPEVEERCFAYADPNDPCEDLPDEPSVEEEETNGTSLNCSPPVLAAICRFLKCSAPFKLRRESYDSGKTAVIPADV